MHPAQSLETEALAAATRPPRGRTLLEDLRMIASRPAGTRAGVFAHGQGAGLDAFPAQGLPRVVMQG
jgi:hypothetical protein